MRKRIITGTKGRILLLLLILLVISICILSLSGKRLFHSLIQTRINKCSIELSDTLYFAKIYRLGAPILDVGHLGFQYGPVARVTYKQWTYSLLRLEIPDKIQTDLSEDVKDNIMKVEKIMRNFHLDFIIIENDRLVLYRFANSLLNEKMSNQEYINTATMDGILL